ncbi:MAG: hypothetical protein ACRD2O_04320, partial [Terriglobia bacterium]
RNPIKRAAGGQVKMRRTLNRWIIVFVTLLCCCGIAFTQQSNSKDPVKAAAKDVAAMRTTQKSPGPEITRTITLLDATRVSTAGALKATAQAKEADLAAKSHQALEGIVSKKPTPTADSAVVELQPAAPASVDGGKPVVAPSRDSKDSLLKNIHGELYGSTAAGIGGKNAEGGAAGATTKGGKTSIYVQSDHTQGPLPH